MGRKVWPPVHGAEDEAHSAADDIRLIGNQDCEHWLCWQVRCRHCDGLLDAHVGAEELTEAVSDLRAGHHCAPVPSAGPARS